MSRQGQLYEAHDPLLTPREMAEVLKRQKAGRRFNLLGKLWNAPNTLLGLGYGALGYGVGRLKGQRPGISLGHNAVQFTDNPFGGVSAITLGNTSIYNMNPNHIDDNGATTAEHEEQHTYQGEQLGPLYLPSNIAGGLWALLRNGNWHGAANWNETGPQLSPPRPWPARAGR